MKTLLLLIFGALALRAQNPAQIIPTTVDPTGQTCNATRMNEKTPDGKIYTCQNGHMAQIQAGSAPSTTSITCTAPAVCTPSPITGTGVLSAPTAVVGPASVTADHLAVFNGTTGKLIKDGGVVPASTANYSQTFTTQTSVALAHNLNTTAVITQCFDNSNADIGWDTLTLTDANTVTVTFTNAQTGKCVVTGNLASGTTFSISTTCGVSGGPITATGTITGIETVNSQTGTTYAIANGDCGKLVTLANAAPIAVSIAQAGTGGLFAAGWFADVQNTGVGTVTITPTTSTINGGSSLVLLTGQGVRIVSNGTNYLIFGSISNGGTVQNITINNSTTNNIKMNHPSLNGTELTNLFPNAASTGTTLNKLVSLTGAGTGVITSAGATGGVIGICTGNTSTGASACGTSGSSEIAIQGTYTCIFDGSTTANDYVTISSSVAGDCHDFGATYPIGQQVLGRVLVTAAAGTRSMVLFGPEFNSSGAKTVQAFVLGATTVTATGNGQYYFTVPPSLNNYRLTGVSAQTITAGTTGPTTAALTRCAHAATGNACSGTTAQMLSTNINVDSGTNSSADAGTPPVINTANATVTTNQVIRVDISAVSTTPAFGLIVNMDFTIP
jgi:hypothetical protein